MQRSRKNPAACSQCATYSPPVFPDLCHAVLAHVCTPTGCVLQSHMDAYQDYRPTQVPTYIGLPHLHTPGISNTCTTNTGFPSVHTLGINNIYYVYIVLLCARLWQCCCCVRLRHCSDISTAAVTGTEVEAVTLHRAFFASAFIVEKEVNLCSSVVSSPCLSYLRQASALPQPRCIHNLPNKLTHGVCKVTCQQVHAALR